MNTPEIRSHEHLRTIVRDLPQDYTPYGQDERWANPSRRYADCGTGGGCRWYIQLPGTLGYDWGVCANPQSHRCGLLTFEHQGCRQYEPADENDVAR